MSVDPTLNVLRPMVASLNVFAFLDLGHLHHPGLDVSLMWFIYAFLGLVVSMLIASSPLWEKPVNAGQAMLATLLQAACLPQSLQILAILHHVEGTLNVQSTIWAKLFAHACQD